MWCFNTWAREEPNRHLNMCASASTGFNTWAREEPNCRFCGGLRSDLEVSILGLARSPTDLVRQYIESILFQYLGSRGAQQPPFKDTVIYHKFQYLGSRGAQLKRPGNDITDCKFQYLGSRGAQLFMSAITSDFFSFNTWAREEPNGNPPHEAPYGAVSILGLARSPTRTIILMDGDSFLFQYLGSRGAQPSLLDASCTNASFNTWAREEPNLRQSIPVFQHDGFNTWAREEPNTVLFSLHHSIYLFQYLGSRGAQPAYFLSLLRDSSFQYLGSRGAQLSMTECRNFGFSFNTWAREEPNLYPIWHSVLRVPCFNTWAREEPNRLLLLPVLRLLLFQYLGSRGAQLFMVSTAFMAVRFQYLGSRGAQPPPSSRSTVFVRCFNTWAREEPNWQFDSMRHHLQAFQYLGSRGAQLAPPAPLIVACRFQYLGSRGAQRCGGGIGSSPPGFNTWAREEPN